jgi:hypothetical protein
MPAHRQHVAVPVQLASLVIVVKLHRVHQHHVKMAEPVQLMVRDMCVHAQRDTLERTAKSLRVTYLSV